MRLGFQGLTTEAWWRVLYLWEAKGKTVSRHPRWEAFPGPDVFREAKGFDLFLSLAAGPGHGAFSSGLARQGTMGLTLCKEA